MQQKFFTIWKNQFNQLKKVSLLSIKENKSQSHIAFVLKNIQYVCLSENLKFSNSTNTITNFFFTEVHYIFFKANSFWTHSNMYIIHFNQIYPITFCYPLPLPQNISSASPLLLVSVYLSVCLSVGL